MDRTSSWNALLTAVVLCAIGCSSENPLGRRAVSGTVNVNGKPVPVGSISFEPLQSGGVGSGAVITNGSYEIADVDGLPVGKYHVGITGSDGESFTVSEGKMPGDDENLQPAKQLVPADWNADGKHDIEITDSGPTEFNFDITTK